MAVNCSGCGSVLDPSVEQVNSTVDQVPQASPGDAQRSGGVCPRCGHSKDVPYTQNLLGFFLLLMACLLVAAIVTIHNKSQKTTQNLAASAAQVEILEANAPAPHLRATYPCVSASVDGGSEVTPRMGSCELAPEGGAPVDRFVADLRYGRFVMRQTDLYLNDVFQVPLTRTYASFSWGHPNPVQAFGRNTGHPYDIAPMGTRNPYTFLMIAFEDGDFVYFPRISKGTGFADAVYQHSESSTRFYKALMRWNGTGWTTTLADGSAIDFPEAYYSKSMAQSAPTEMRNPHGDKLELLRDRPRNLQEILTPHGRWIKFQYDGLSRVVYAVTDSGQWAKYEYTPEGMLSSAVLSSGKERHYTYDGHLMLTVTDERGHTLVRNTYTQGVLTRQTFANGQTYSYSYTWAKNYKHVDVAHVTTPDGSVKDIPMDEYAPDWVKQPGQ